MITKQIMPLEIAIINEEATNDVKYKGLIDEAHPWSSCSQRSLGVPHSQVSI